MTEDLCPLPPLATMSPWLSNFIRLRLTAPWPLVIYAATWTALLTLTVAVASFSPEVAFVSAISPSSFSYKCETDGSSITIRVPLDVPGETLCFPAESFTKSRVDLIVPAVFAAVIVAASACVVRSVGLWEDDQTH